MFGDVTDKAKLHLPRLRRCQRPVAAHFSLPVRGRSDLLCLFAHYGEVLTCRYASSHPSSLQHAFSLGSFSWSILTLPPLSGCCFEAEYEVCFRTESCVYGSAGLQGPELRALILHTACR